MEHLCEIPWAHQELKKYLLMLKKLCFVCWAILLFCWLYHFAAVKSEKIKPWISLGFTVETQDVEKMDNFATDIFWSGDNIYIDYNFATNRY